MSTFAIAIAIAIVLVVAVVDGSKMEVVDGTIVVGSKMEVVGGDASNVESRKQVSYHSTVWINIRPTLLYVHVNFASYLADIPS